jgi:hypothetical protein
MISNHRAALRVQRSSYPNLSRDLGLLLLEGAVRNLGMGGLMGDTSIGGPLYERPSFTMDPQRTDLL